MSGTVTLIPTTSHGTPVGNYDGTSTSFFSDKSESDGYYGYTDGLHTIAAFPNAFVGTIKFQGSLATDPGDSDWVDIPGITIGDGATATSTAVTHNFTGNFVWVRAKVESFTAGSITKVQFNY
tara:strand:- start:1959 stop:2327 length:369 start_codon:yes stop_codon:yes gene_type:complete